MLLNVYLNVNFHKRNHNAIFLDVPLSITFHPNTVDTDAVNNCQKS